ncbi:serine hydrolase domain-containing protein [Dyella sp. 20L07]|uniref:serine hydrolase domain-containing protein n=1 Tax=Dyella sp. 20L07 TaxID=3384240 RepID=UPI003D2D58B6
MSWRRMALALIALAFSGTALAQCDQCPGIAKSFARDEAFNGVILVAHGAQVDYVEGFGLADAGTSAPFTADTRVETGSISKWIAAMVVMRLVQQGQLALDEPIATYLPEYRRDNGRKLTLRTLMSHSSGVPNQVDAAIKRDPTVRDLSLNNAEAVKRFASGDLLFEPGTDWDYSHANWLIVKAVIETVTEKTYADLVNDFLLMPLNLHNSGIFTGDSARVPGMAHGYARMTPQPEPLIKATPNFMVLAGGYYASANDMLRLMDGLFGGKILSPEATTTLMTVVRPTQGYALGGRTKVLAIEGREHSVAWEYGSNGAFRVLAWRTLDDGHSIIIMNNTSFDHLKLGALATQLLEASYH